MSSSLRAEGGREGGGEGGREGEREGGGGKGKRERVRRTMYEGRETYSVE